MHFDCFNILAISIKSSGAAGIVICTIVNLPLPIETVAIFAITEMIVMCTDDYRVGGIIINSGDHVPGFSYCMYK